jgi:hypothetical protein
MDRASGGLAPLRTREHQDKPDIAREPAGDVRLAGTTSLKF